MSEPYTKPQIELLQVGECCHVYNRGNNRENLFREKQNYAHSLKLYGRHIAPIAETYAFCLLSNHFHLLIRIREHALDAHRTSQQFSNLFNAYARSFNKTYGRTGTLFAQAFKRKHVATDAYITRAVVYIHRNPQHHGFVRDFRTWQHSSFHALRSTLPTRLSRTSVRNYFGGLEPFLAAHA